MSNISLGTLYDINKNLVLNSATTVVDAKKCKMYSKNFGEFFNNQIEFAKSIVLSHTSGVAEEKLAEAISLIREHNESATLITTDWEEISGADILDAMEQKRSLSQELEELLHEHKHHHEHHHDEQCDCGCHEHGHHHADDVFTSWGKETTHKYTKEELIAALQEIGDEEKYGTVLRAKGIVEGAGAWLHFDYVPEEHNVRTGSAAVIGRICVIGAELNEAAIAELFGV